MIPLPYDVAKNKQFSYFFKLHATTVVSHRILLDVADVIYLFFLNIMLLSFIFIRIFSFFLSLFFSFFEPGTPLSSPTHISLFLLVLVLIGIAVLWSKVLLVAEKAFCWVNFSQFSVLDLRVVSLFFLLIFLKLSS